MKNPVRSRGESSHWKGKYFLSNICTCTITIWKKWKSVARWSGRSHIRINGQRKYWRNRPGLLILLPRTAAITTLCQQEESRPHLLKWKLQVYRPSPHTNPQPSGYPEQNPEQRSALSCDCAFTFSASVNFSWVRSFGSPEPDLWIILIKVPFR